MLCVTTDYVEDNLDWESQVYEKEGVAYRRCQLRMAPPDEIIAAARDADVLVVDQARITADVIAGLDRCSLIIRHGDGFDNLDLEAATQSGIICINEPGFWSREVAEQAFAMGCSLALRIPVQQQVARTPRTGINAGWDLSEVKPYQSLGSLTVGIIGCGRIGSLAAELYRPLVSRVLVYDPYVGDGRISRASGENTTLDYLLAESDIVSLHVPASDDTIGMIDEKRLAQMKDGALLVNTARGAVVDTDAVVGALESGKLGGAALDATVPEPLPADHALFALRNVIITPHMGWYSEDALWNLRRQIVADVLGMRDGKIPASVVNPEVLGNPGLRASKHRPGAE